MGSLLRFDLRALRDRFGLGTLYETGTGLGASIAWAHECGWRDLHSVEQDAETFARARANLAQLQGGTVHLVHGYSTDLLGEVEPNHPTPRLFFLDAHFVGGVDFRPSKDWDTYIDSLDDPRSLPLIDELRLLAPKVGPQDWLIIDDARIYYDAPFAAGSCPEQLRQWHLRKPLEGALRAFAATHSIRLLLRDHGYLVVIPKGIEMDEATFIRSAVRASA